MSGRYGDVLLKSSCSHRTQRPDETSNRRELMRSGSTNLVSGRRGRLSALCCVFEEQREVHEDSYSDGNDDEYELRLH